ncbi:uncharacterized protein N7483_007090 [Penicillium malachiteum]|uniref:uncharacterized protein n=1 Tax=Penicillium malachiteum TaxID=1324776 RepID=UPI0025474E6D|nr:uncharacterized protein N7483_007090 [Penicillium malachiteum]KAJ5725733.1 hypothetical protein N7483_007090 [Penicillium malachiteum]
MYPEDEDALLSIQLLCFTIFCAVSSYLLWRYISLKPMKQDEEQPVFLDINALGDRPRVQYFPSYGRENAAAHSVV